MTGTDLELTVLGSRGSMACVDPALRDFGGDSSCYLVRAGGETIFLDAGSGMLRAPAHYDRAPLVLLSHLHLDHLIGLGMFPGLSVPGQGLRLYVPFCRSGEEAEETMNRIYAPPFWPIRMSQSECGAAALPMPETIEAGDVRIDCAVGNHPDGCMLFRISHGGKSLVYATDYEHEESSFERLAAFARDTDLLLYDAQYSEEEYPRFKGFGHSTPEKGLELMARSGAKRLLLVHHAPWATDEMLYARETRLPAGASYAREGQVITL